MKYLYSLNKTLFLSFLTLTALLVMGNNANSQTCGAGNATANCAVLGVTENFNTNNGGFASTDFSYSTLNHRWEVAAAQKQHTYSIATASYQVTASGIVTIGFETAGTATYSFYNIVFKSGATTVLSCSNVTFISGTGCYTATGFAPGTNLTVTISIRTANGSGGDGTIFFDDFKTNLPSAAPLPVEMTSFSSKRNGDNVVLNWATASESINKGFEIQRRYTQQPDFQTIGFVSSKGLYGNSSETLTYSYTDANTSAGVSYYRIRQVDLDGHFKYSEIRAVDGSDSKAKTLVYPNPSVNGNVNIVFTSNEARNIQVSDMNGRMIKSWNNYQNQELKIDKMKPGIYLVQINNIATGAKEAQRIVVAQ